MSNERGIAVTVVRELREQTGAGVLDCKQALEKAQGDIEKAKRLLKEMGLAAVGNRRARATAVGRIFIVTSSTNRAVMLELRCESDFVARNSSFVALGNTIGRLLVQEGTADKLEEQIQTALNEAISTIKENISLARYVVWEQRTSEIVVHYLHGDAGTLGAMLRGSYNQNSSVAKEELELFLSDIVLHVAAYRPQYLSQNQIEPVYLQEQEEIFQEQAKKLNKPEHITADIVKGKLHKHLKEISLLTQPFLKDESKTVAQYLEKQAPAGSGLTIDEYTVYVAGEKLNNE